MMMNASHDMIALVENVGIKMQSTVPDYVKYVVGDARSHSLPKAEAAKKWIDTFLQVHERFMFKRDFRFTSAELSHIAELAGWLIGLHQATHFANTGERLPMPNLTIHEAAMVANKIIMG